MTSLKIQQREKTIRALVATVFALVAIPGPLVLHRAFASEYATVPYANYDAFPVPTGGCDDGKTWCDNFDNKTGRMNLSDFPFSGQYDASFVEWNIRPPVGNSPTAYYAWQYPVEWGATWDAVGSIIEQSWPFYGEMEIGGLLVECMDTTPNCSSNNYQGKGLLGVDWTSDTVNGEVHYQYQQSSKSIMQQAGHLYAAIPVGYTSAFANDCENSCYGAGYTDFGLGSNYLLVRNVYAFPEE